MSRRDDLPPEVTQDPNEPVEQPEPNNMALVVELPSTNNGSSEDGPEDATRSVHLQTEAVAEWTKPRKPPFRPNKRQVEFKKCAEKMASKGKYFRWEWFMATTKKGWVGETVTDTEWRVWVEKDKRFEAWFWKDFIMSAGITEQEMRMLESQFWIGVRDGMQEGEEWAYKQFAKVRFDTNKKTQTNSETMQEFRDYFNSASGASWNAQLAEA